MGKTRFSVREHELELICELSGKEYIIYDNKIVSEKRNVLSLSSVHNFEVTETAKVVNYSVSFKGTLSGLIQYNVNRNNIQIKKGVMSSMTLGLLRIFFLFMGLGFTANGGLLIIVRNYIEYLSSTYSPDELIGFYIDQGINLIFGVFFLIFAFWLKRILLKLLKLITTLLWIRIGMMLVTMSFVFWNLIQEQIFSPWLILRILFIWLFWSLLENCKAISKELKLQTK
ncbi:MAG: hypothetical protein F6K40_28995 [Okeania sp. SIO3I5]|uniref:hypothetical protein n=1 Tax=Okeania sp. SIO3I5 TaxID=2607805 RepID=UPI0013BD53B1|nr:hypothetical protein [Okeania sp. SIO3I5]NEQ40058.1 hypothetical protein [Okeania sp. SIO3I5]